MSDYVDIHVSMRIKADAPADLAEQVMSLVGRKNGMRTDHASRISLGKDIEIPSIALPDDVDGAIVVDGRLHVDSQACNAQRPREHLDGRTELLALVQLLDRFCAEPVGAIVGAVYGDWQEGSDAGPMIVTGEGIAIFVSGHDSMGDYGYGSWYSQQPKPVVVTSIDPTVAARLTRDSEPGWGGGYGSISDSDEAEIAAWARSQTSAVER